MEGCALIDMVARHGVPIPVIYLDTMFFFPETYALRDRMVARYPHLRFENRGTTLTPEAQAERYRPRALAPRSRSLLRAAEGRADAAGAAGRGRVDHRPHAEPGRRARRAPRAPVERRVRARAGEPAGRLGPAAGLGLRASRTTCPTTSCTSAAIRRSAAPTAPARCPARARATTPAPAAGPAPTRPSAACTSTLHDTWPERREAAMTGQPESKVEVAKRQGRHLRGTIAETLASDADALRRRRRRAAQVPRHVPAGRSRRAPRARGRRPREGVQLHGAGGDPGRRVTGRAVPRARAASPTSTATAPSG